MIGFTVGIYRLAYFPTSMPVIQHHNLRNSRIIDRLPSQSRVGVLLPLFCFWGCYPLEGENRQTPLEPAVRLIAVNVKQGDAILIDAESGLDSAFLIDTGPPLTRWDTLAPHLGVTHIQGLFLTHSDADHIGGVLALMQKVSIQKIFIPSRAVFSRNTLGLALLEKAARLGIPVDTLRTGRQIPIASTANLSVLWPPEDTLIDGNEGSLVLRLTCGPWKALLMGDAGLSVESRLLEAGVSLQSQVLKVGHHGSRSSSHAGFLKAVQPDFAVISCDSNAYGHPHREVLDHLVQVLDNPKNLLRTDQVGNLYFRAGPGGWKWEGP